MTKPNDNDDDDDDEARRKSNEIGKINSETMSSLSSVRSFEYLRTFSDCSYAQPNEHISAHHYENFYDNLFHFYIYSIRYSISVNGRGISYCIKKLV